MSFFGRQVGSYPLLIGLPYPYEIGEWIDVAVTGRGPKSVIGIVHPTLVNSASLSMLEAVPGIGKKRAMAIVRQRPFTNELELRRLLGDEPVAQAAMKRLSIDGVRTG